MRASRTLALAASLFACTDRSGPSPAVQSRPTVPAAVASARPRVARSFRFPQTESAQLVAEQAPAAPLSLTASDGTGLELVSLVAKGVVDDPLAFTELRMTFK